MKDITYSREKYLQRKDYYKKRYREHRKATAEVRKADDNSIPIAKTVKNAYKWYGRPTSRYLTFAYDSKSNAKLHFPSGKIKCLQVVYNCYIPYHSTAGQVKDIDDALRKLFGLKWWQSITTIDRETESHKCKYINCTVTSTLQLVDCDCPAVEQMQDVEKIIRHILHADYITSI